MDTSFTLHASPTSHASHRAATNAAPSTAVRARSNERLLAAAEELAQLNRQYIALLALDVGLPDTLTPRIRCLPNVALSAMADCRFSLFTLGFNDSRRWRRLLDSVSDCASQEPMPSTATAHSAAHSEFVSSVVFLAWHLAHSDPVAAKVLLELDGIVAAALCGVRIADLRAVGAGAANWLQPRWPQNRFFWPALVRFSSDPAGAGLRATKLLGRQLLAAESIALAPPPPVGAARRLSVVRSNRSV